MAKCRLCKKNVPDGNEHCEDCLDKKQVKTDESYLDSLLNSVKNNSEPIQSNYKKPQEPRNPEPVKANNKAKNIRPDQIDPTDLADFDHFNLNEDLDDLIMISDEELYGHVEDFPDDDKASPEIHPDLNEQNIHNTPQQEENFPIQDPEVLLQDMGLDDKETEVPLQNTSEDLEAGDPLTESDYMKMVDQLGQDTAVPNSDPDHHYDDIPVEASKEPETITNQSDEAEQDPSALGADPSLQGIQDNIDLDFLNKFSNPAMEELDDESYDPSLGELLSGFGLSEEEHPSDEDISEPLSGGINVSSPASDAEEVTKQTDEEEFLSLIGQFGTDDPVAADVQAITDLLNNPADKPLSESMPSNVGDVFSDALKAVSGLDDLEDADHSYPMQEQMLQIDPKAKNKKSKVQKEGEPEHKKVKATKGQGFFGKLFGNVVDEKAIKEAKKSKASEESAATKEKKKGKGKKAKKNASENIEEIKDTPKRQAPGEENPEETKAKKKEKKPKKEKKKPIELIDDYEEIEGRINRLGATVVFTFFGIMVALLLIGTSLFTYSVSIKNAKTYFDRQKYTEAYNEVYGMELKDEDIELYEKIMTVMFVNKQLNSYNNYHAMKKYPEALDSLMKGLKRYDKYIELATMLGIKSDLDYVRDQIMGELEHVYRLSEKEAEEILSINSQRDYSIAVYNAVIENMKY